MTAGRERVVAFREAVEARLADRTVRVPAEHVGLAGFDLDAGAAAFVWACVAVAIDPMMYPHAIAVGGPDGRRGLTPSAYAALTGVDEATAIELACWLASDPTIVKLGLLERDAHDLLPIATPYRATPRLVAHVLDGVEAPRIGRLVEPVPEARHDAAQRAALEALARGLASGRLVIVEGARGVGRRTAVALCTPAPVIALDASRIALAELDRSLRALCAEALLRGAVPVIADLDRAAARDEERLLIAPLVARIVDDLPGPIAITTTTPGLELPVQRAVDRVALPMADVATRLALWTDALGARLEPEALREIALRHKLGAGQIVDAARSARESGNGVVAMADVIRGIRATLADRFGSYVERLEVTDSWDDVVLPAELTDQLVALVGRVRHAWKVFEDWRFPRQTARGGGVAALFSGPPGTGKTMVAGLLARELGRDLYRIDLSQIVSKWVGETEKQLGQVFDAAESGNALLLFDEADSLFAKRTEIKSSSDRYANLEVNYLLQRIETFGGVTILTTNLDASIDPALRRRLAAHIVFWPPEHDERVTLWRRFLAAGAPISGAIDFDALARDYPDMTGANIRNAALAAAFLAASEDGRLDDDRLHRAARAEYRAMGRVLAGRT